MLKKSLILATAIASLSPLSSQAATLLGVEAGAYQWNTGFSGDVGKHGGSDLDVEKDMKLEDEGNLTLYAALEHPVPFLPNIKLQRTALEGEKEGGVDFSHLDGTLYYEILDNWVSLDFGFTVRKFSGGITPSKGAKEVELTKTVPMLYGKASFDLPFSGLSASMTANTTSFKGGQMDLDMNLTYEFAFGLGAMVGYRNYTLELDDLADIDTDITLDGYYLGVSYKF